MFWRCGEEKGRDEERKMNTLMEAKQEDCGGRIGIKGRVEEK